MKAFTSLEQSKKLAEILPIESADMRYAPFGDTHPWFWDDNLLEKGAIPCWSLAALLDIFPCGKELPLVNLTRGGWIPSFTRRWFATWEDENKNIFYSGDGITSVDAVVELILKLHEQKVL